MVNYQEKEKKHNQIVLLVKAKLNTIEVLISKSLVGSCISHDEFISINDILQEHNETKEEIQNSETPL